MHKSFLVMLYSNHFFTLHDLDRVKRIWYLSPMRAAKVLASLRIRAVSPEPSLLAHTSSESRGTFRQKARSLAPLNGWACAVKICHDGMLEDTNSLDGAHFTKLYFRRVLSFRRFHKSCYFRKKKKKMWHLRHLSSFCQPRSLVNVPKDHIIWITSSFRLSIPISKVLIKPAIARQWLHVVYPHFAPRDHNF